MRALVLGGTGLISGAIVRELKQQGHAVSVFHRGHTPLETPGVEEILGDRSQRPAFEAAFRKRRFDAVFDLIAFNPQDAASAWRAFRGRVGHFVHCSTVCASVLPTEKVPADESEPLRPLSGYGRAKAAAERFWMGKWAAGRFPVTIIRPSHTYGPGGRIVLGTFVDGWDRDCAVATRILAGKPLLVHGDGEGLWQSCYADDLAEGFIGAARRRRTLGQVYNMAGPEVFTWNEYHRRLGEGLGRKVRLFHLPTEVILAKAPARATGFLAEIGRFHGAYSNAKALRDVPEFRPRTSLQKGVRRQLAWLRRKGYLKLAPARPYEDRLCRLAARLKA